MIIRRLTRRTYRRSPRIVWRAWPLVLLLAGAGTWQATSAWSDQSVDCSHLPSPGDLRWVQGTEGAPVRVAAPSGYYPGCDEPGDPISATADWGDGTVSAMRVEWEGDQMMLVGEHVYERPQDQTQIDIARRNDRTGVVYHDLHYVAVIGATAPDVAVRDGTWAAEGATIAGVRVRGRRNSRELTARIKWGDGRSSRGRVVGTGKRFKVKAAHRYRGRDRRVRVHVSVRDMVGRKRATGRGWLVLTSSSR